jgi:hypothetical protein
MRRLQLILALTLLLSALARANHVLVVADHKPTRREIAKLIDQLTTKDASDAANKLLSFGLDGVPMIIERLDDRRPIGTNSIGYFANIMPEGFESVAHYSPKQVVDCLHTILSLITEANVKCGLDSGGTDAQRVACIERWRAWGKAHPIPTSKPQ